MSFLNNKNSSNGFFISTSDSENLDKPIYLDRENTEIVFGEKKFFKTIVKNDCHGDHCTKDRIVYSILNNNRFYHFGFYGIRDLENYEIDILTSLKFDM